MKKIIIPTTALSVALSSMLPAMTLAQELESMSPPPESCISISETGECITDIPAEEPVSEPIPVEEPIVVEEPIFEEPPQEVAPEPEVMVEEQPVVEEPVPVEEPVQEVVIEQPVEEPVSEPEVIFEEQPVVEEPVVLEEPTQEVIPEPEVIIEEPFVEPMPTEESALEPEVVIEEPIVIEEESLPVEEQPVFEEPVVEPVPVEEPVQEVVIEQPAEEVVVEPEVIFEEQPVVEEQPVIEQPVIAPEDVAIEPQVTEETIVEEPVATEEGLLTADDLFGSEDTIAQEPTATEEPAVIEESNEAADVPVVEEDVLPMEPVRDPAPEDVVVEEIQPITIDEVISERIEEINQDITTEIAAEDPNTQVQGEVAVTEDALKKVDEIVQENVTLDNTQLDVMSGSANEAQNVITQVVTPENSRSADEEFAAKKAAEARKERRERNLERVGLFALGALTAGVILSNQNRVVNNTGDRVIMERDDGDYVVYKDDDAILRQPGVVTTTETYRDGSSRTILNRGDGTQVVTIRDSLGRVIRRAAYDEYGREVIIIDDMVREVPVDVRVLPKPTPRIIYVDDVEDAEYILVKTQKENDEIGRKFSLRQIREIPEVRKLAPVIEVENITFASNSSSLTRSQAEELRELGNFMKQRLARNPDEVFLIEGHTDAVGSASYNLLLSDRRAETVALALTQYFKIPPENMVVQGYGESELKVNTQEDERANRRVEVRVITSLMR